MKLIISYSTSLQKISNRLPIICKIYIYSLLLLFNYHFAQSPLTTHPRLWFNTTHLTELQAKATPTNPMFQQGLLALTNYAINQMDNIDPGDTQPDMPYADPGNQTYATDFTESYAALFAFMGQIETNPTLKANYKNRGKKLLMYIMNKAYLGAANAPFRHPDFITSDRGRWVGHCFPLAVDWLYNDLSVNQKDTIREVFSRWYSESMDAYPSLTYYHTAYNGNPINPSYYGTNQLLDLTDPKKRQARSGANNYFMAHGRNIGLMALAIDSLDDTPNGTVPGDFADRVTKDALNTSLKAYLFMTDHAYRNEFMGGLSPEGMEYFEAVGFPLHLLLALKTSGNDNIIKWGQQVDFNSNPFWNLIPNGYISGLSLRQVGSSANHNGIDHAPDLFNSYSNWGTTFQPAWYGDGENYFAGDAVPAFGALGIIAKYQNDQNTLNKTKWIQLHVPPGGARECINRARSQENVLGAVMLYMMYSAAEAQNIYNFHNGNFGAPYSHDLDLTSIITDPRLSLNKTFYAPGVDKIIDHTDWTTNGRMFSFMCGKGSIDHQHADANMIDFYRKGEWLTKQRTGYGNYSAATDYHNSLSVMNDTTMAPTDQIPGIHKRRGSQFTNGASAGDGTIAAQSSYPAFLYSTGDATKRYNYYDGFNSLNKVSHVSRSVVWLKPDVIILYDRAETQAFTNPEKRFNLNLPDANPSINGNTITSITPSGQNLIINRLLPANASVSINVSGDTDAGFPDWSYSAFDPMGVVAPGAAPYNSTNALRPARYMASVVTPSTRFLHVIEGTDAGGTAQSSNLIQSVSGNQFEGVQIGSRAILFIKNWGEVFTSTSYTCNNVNAHILTGVSPNATYNATLTVSGGITNVQVTSGNTYTADAGGGLIIGDPNSIQNIHQPVNELSIKIYPNPGSDHVFIESLNNIVLTDIFIADALGRIVLKQKISGSNTEVNISSLTKGIYFVTTQGSDGISYTKKLIKN